MSTTIYDGLMLELPEPGLAGAQAWMVQARALLEPAVLQGMDRVLAQLTVDRMDEEVLVLGDLLTKRLQEDARAPVLGTGDLLLEAEYAVARRQKAMRSSDHGDPAVDFSIEVVVFAHPTDPQKALAIPYAGQRDLKKSLLELPGVSEFGYWDNTDEPEGMDMDAWRARGVMWDEALGERGVPSDRGLRLEIISERFAYIPQAPRIAQVLPNHAKRVKRWAHEVAFQRLTAEETVSASNAMRWYQEAANPKNPVVAQAYEDVRQALPATYDLPLLQSMDRREWHLQRKLHGGLPPAHESAKPRL